MNTYIQSILAGFVLILSQSICADSMAARTEGKQRILHFAAVSHLIGNPLEEAKLSTKNQDIVTHIKTSAPAALATFKTAMATNEDAALRGFANYLLEVCDKACLKEHVFMSLPKACAPTASIEDVVALIKRAVKLIDAYGNTVYEKPLYQKALDAVFFNYVTTRFVPNVLKYAVMPLILIPSAAKTLKELPWRQIVDDDLYRSGNNYYDSDWAREWRSERRKVVRRDFAEGMKSALPYAARGAALAALSYYAGKFIMKVQEQRYLDRENKRQKNALLNTEMGRVVIKQDDKKISIMMKLLAYIPWFKPQAPADEIVISADVKEAAEYLHNPEGWWKTQNPGIHGLIIAGPEAAHSKTVQALAKETKTAYVEISFLQASYKEKVQAIMNRAQAHAMAFANKAMIIHINNIDFIASGSKAAKNIAEILFGAQSNPYLNILVVGSVQNTAQIPTELRPYFA